MQVIRTLLYCRHFYLRTVAVVLVSNGLLLDIVCELDTAVLDRKSLSDIAVALGSSFKDFVGHLSGDGAYTLIVLDALAEVGKALTFDCTIDAVKQRAVGCSRDGERGAYRLGCELHHLYLLGLLIAKEAEHDATLERQIAEDILLTANVGLDIASVTELLLIPLGIAASPVGSRASLVGDIHKLCTVVGAASLKAGTEG